MRSRSWLSTHVGQNLHMEGPKILSRTIIALLLSLLLVPISQSWGDIDQAAFTNDLRAITQPACRSIATDGYYQTAKWIQAEIGKLPNVELQVHEYPVVVPVTESATLTFADGSAERVYPFWPAGARVCATP